MVMIFHFAHKWYLVGALGCLLIFVLYKIFKFRPTMYKFPLTQFIIDQKIQASTLSVQFFFWIRLICLILMVMLIGKPQLMDQKSKTMINGIDIVLALDVSGSMICFDDLNDQRTRLTVAKQEALKFIEKRVNDSLGLVIFGRYALTRCPLTVDKSILKTIVNELEIGQPSIDMQQQTMLSLGIITAARRLQKSQAKSKIIILLTDGEPSQEDLPSQDAIKIAQELGIKIYTIGIGSDQGGFIVEPGFGVRRVHTPLNKTLLEQIANKTGGKFFESKNSKDLAQIYEIIDRLEKHQTDVELYHQYYDYFMPILWLIVILLLFELMISTWVWFIV